MRAANLLVLCVPLAVACATRRDTGHAMVMGGATVASMAAMSSGKMVCTTGPCAVQGSKTGAAVALAGMGVAVAGHAISESANRDRNNFPPRAASSATQPPRDWHLVRAPDQNEPAPASSAAPVFCDPVK
jgi:hypothetical protein